MEYLAGNATQETERGGDNANGAVDETLPMDYSIKARKGKEVGIRMCLEQTKGARIEKRMESKNADINRDTADESVETFTDETHDVAYINKKEEA